MDRFTSRIIAAGALGLAALAQPVPVVINPHKRVKAYGDPQKQPHSRGPARQPKRRKNRSHNTKRSR